MDKSQRYENFGLKTEYLFENFVQTEENQWAKAAAVAVAEKSGDIFNPLFIYGESGLGKTHLLHAIGNEILKNNPYVKIKYISAETFVNDYENAVRFQKINEFEEMYHNLDILLVDDVQHFSKNENTQAEFLTIFINLCDRGDQVVLTSDRNPKELRESNEFLQDIINRIEWGLVTNIAGSVDYK